MPKDFQRLLLRSIADLFSLFVYLDKLILGKSQNKEWEIGLLRANFRSSHKFTIRLNLGKLQYRVNRMKFSGEARQIVPGRCKLQGNLKKRSTT